MYVCFNFVNVAFNIIYFAHELYVLQTYLKNNLLINFEHTVLYLSYKEAENDYYILC